MYQLGLDLEILGKFEDHSGFDGVIIGNRNSQYHLEFTHHREAQAPRSNSKENLLVFYMPDETAWGDAVKRMLHAGFISVVAINPYWAENGATFEDLEGYRVVLSKENWVR